MSSTTVNKIDNALVFTAGMPVDCDGAPNAYGSNDSGLDLTANAGHPGNWFGVLTDESGEPVVQGPSDPCPGFYISTTSLRDHSKKLTDPTAYVDATQVPYFTACPELRAMGVHFGDVGIAHYKVTGKACAGVVADGSPHNHLGESSVAMAKALGIPASPRHGGCDSGVVFVIFPASSKGWPRTNQDIAEQVQELLQGSAALQGLLTS